jgi:hypothetical protein
VPPPLLGGWGRDCGSHRSGVTCHADGGQGNRYGRGGKSNGTVDIIFITGCKSVWKSLFKVMYYINNIPVVSFVCVNFLFMLFSSCSTPLILRLIPRIQGRKNRGVGSQGGQGPPRFQKTQKCPLSGGKVPFALVKNIQKIICNS